MQTMPPPANLYDHLNTAVILADEEHRLCLVNIAAQALFSRSKKQLLGVPLGQVLDFVNLDYQRIEAVTRRNEDFAAVQMALRVSRQYQLTADVNASCIVVDNRPHLLLEIRLVDQQLRISKEDQQWAQQHAAQALIRGLAHEIKNPLGGLRGAAQLLERQLKDEKLREYTQLIMAQADRLGTLVDNLLGPNHRPDFAFANVHRVLEQVRQLLVLDKAHGVVIARDYDPSIPELLMDANMLQQAVLNIAQNGIQAMGGEGRLVLRSRIEPGITIQGVKHALCVVISVIDSGPGVPEPLRDSLFYPLVTGRDEGTGLGLSISQRLVEQHKGKIELTSAPGHTEFKIYLPIGTQEQG